MNKDVIYIEPEDDITDIITKIENSKEKIVALVPPKKAGVFRSIVNIKLITKAGINAEKTIVLVTTDPSIIKLAAVTKLPVTKNLQSAPVMPKLDEESDTEAVTKEEVIEASGKDKAEKVIVKEITVESADEDSEDDENAEKVDEEEAGDENSDNGEKAEKKKRSSDKKSASGNKFIDWIKEHKKISIGCGIGLVVLILIAIWAFAIAPAATVTVGVRTVENNFSQGVTFTDNLSEENVNEGKFYLEEKKIESKKEVEFTATGSRNDGEKATGQVVIYTYFREQGDVAISAGSTFTINGLSYVLDNNVTLSWNQDPNECKNTGEASSFTSGCLIYEHVSVTAAAPGEKYNIAASSAGWSTNARVSVYSDSAMSGGTDKMVTVVQQSDIEKAKESLSSEDESASKEKLLATIGEDAFVIDSSFKQTVGNVISTPAVNEEAADGKAKLTVVTTDSIYIIDKTKVEEFISEKAKLADNYKIYKMNDPFIENFMNTGSGYTGKLKTSYVSGPKVTENDIIEIIKGKGLGVAQHDLKEIDGVGTIKIDVSYPWVMSIPGDPNKITVIIEVEE
ncbi:hypothetical protein IKF02_02195 [Candidatus Saccharibacteria bacterium]|nr:hypothetical protein [Candidatus Saccharibacteria bacterium]